MFGKSIKRICFNWKPLLAIACTSSFFFHSTTALCNSSSKSKTASSTTEYQKYFLSKPDNNMLEWGLHSSSKYPTANDYFTNIVIRKMQFSSNVECVLDMNGNLHFKYSNDEWQMADKIFHKISDVCITDDTLYMIIDTEDNGKELLQFMFHTLPNKYQDPCLDTLSSINKSSYKFQYEQELRDMKNCIDHRRKKSFSSMPIAKYHQSMEAYPWNTTQEFVSFIEEKYKTSFVHKKLSLAENETLMRVYANNYRSFVLTTHGRVFARGDNQRGACGTGLKQRLLEEDAYSHLFLREFTEIEECYFDSPVIEIAMGEDHTLFMTALGRVFCSGAANCMQLGLGWTKNKCIQSNSNWNAIGEAGFETTALAFNECNLDNNEYFFEVPSYDEFYPRVITGPYFDNYRVISIAAGDYHSVAIVEPLDEINPLMKVRASSSEMLDVHRYERGLEELEGMSMVEQKLREKANLRENANIRNLDLSEMRRVITWGSSLCGQLGHCNYANASEPKPILSLEQFKEYNEEFGDNIKIKPLDVECGKEHTLVLMAGLTNETSAMVFAFGNNRYHQVSNKSRAKENKPHWIQHILPQNWSIQKIAAGNFQSAAFGSQNENKKYQM